MQIPFILIPLFISTTIDTPMQKEKYIWQYYSYELHVRPEDGKPSRRDTDYFKLELQLNEDNTFTFLEQKGLFQISFRKESRGTWHPNALSEIQLNILSETTTHNRGFDNVPEYSSHAHVVKLEWQEKNLVYWDKILQPEGKIMRTIHAPKDSIPEK